MRAADFQSVTPAQPPSSLPIDIRQSSSVVGSLGTLLCVAPAGLALLAPFIMVADNLVAEPASRQMLIDRPTSAALLAIGLVVWCALLARPLHRSLAGLGRARRVAIADGRVEVEERRLTGTRRWTEPLAEYAGVMHLVRTTLSTTRHELVLVHPDASRSVLVAVADQLGETQIAGIAAMLGQPVIPSSARYSRKAMPAAGWAPEADTLATARA